MKIYQRRFCFALIAPTLACLLSHLAYANGDPSVRKQLIDAMAKVRYGQTSTKRQDAAGQLADLTSKIDPKKVDHKTLSEMVALLYTPEDGVRGYVALALGNLGPRAKKAAAPKLLSLLPEVDCIKLEVTSAPAIRVALKEMGVDPPPPPPECK